MFGSFTKMFVEYNICYRENLNKMLPFREIVHKLLFYFETLSKLRSQKFLIFNKVSRHAIVKKQLELDKKLRFIQEDVNCMIPSKYRDRKKMSNQTKSPNNKQVT